MALDLPFYLIGMSGKFGDVVFYQLQGKTFARKAPGSYNKIPTAKQAAARLRFIAAHRFGQSVIADPALKALYEKNLGKHISAYSKAVSAYLNGHKE